MEKITDGNLIFLLKKEFPEFIPYWEADIEYYGMDQGLTVRIVPFSDYVVDIIKSKKDSMLYTGCTDNLRERFNLHNAGRILSTKGRGSFVLIYYEACINQQDAYTREKYLKTGMGKRYLKNRLKRSLSLTG